MTVTTPSAKVAAADMFLRNHSLFFIGNPVRPHRCDCGRRVESGGRISRACLSHMLASVYAAVLTPAPSGFSLFGWLAGSWLNYGLLLLADLL